MHVSMCVGYVESDMKHSTYSSAASRFTKTTLMPYLSTRYTFSIFLSFHIVTSAAMVRMGTRTMPICINATQAQPIVS